MPIILSDYDKLLECKGNKHNKIYIVQHRQTKTRCILKIIDIYERESQLREIEVHKKLNHKYVIKMLEYELKGNKIIMLIELAKHGDLYNLLPNIDELGERRILKMYYRILKALEYLHSLHYVHRDIKPENILITNNFKPKLADFGTSAKKNIIANTFCGTYEYMAPEVYLRCKQNDRVDVWAVGILLYEITHRKTPFRDDTLQSIKDKLESKTLYFKSDINEKIKDFIYYALKFNPKHRPSITELLNHKLFDNIRPINARKSTAKTQLKAQCCSLKDLDGMMTQSQPDYKSPGNNKTLKLPVHTQIFDSEYSNKNVENFTKKKSIWEYLKKIKQPKAIQTSRNYNLDNVKMKIKAKQDIPQTPAHKLKKIKTLQDIITKPNIYNFVSAKKKNKIVISASNLNKSTRNKNITQKQLIKSSSIEDNLLKFKKGSLKSMGSQANLKGLLYNLYERKGKLGPKSVNTIGK